MNNKLSVIVCGAVLLCGVWAYGHQPGISPSHEDCCGCHVTVNTGPKPEDIRSYYAYSNPPSIDVVIIPEVEGPNGFMITDIVTVGYLVYIKVDGVTVAINPASSHRFGSGIPVPAGSEVIINSGGPVILSGYVY